MQRNFRLILGELMLFACYWALALSFPTLVWHAIATTQPGVEIPGMFLATAFATCGLLLPQRSLRWIALFIMILGIWCLWNDCYYCYQHGYLQGFLP